MKARGSAPRSPRSPHSMSMSGDRLKESEALLTKWEHHEGDMLSKVCELQAENEKLRVLLKKMFMKVGGGISLEKYLASEPQLSDPCPEVPFDHVFGTVEQMAQPRAGDGKWFEAQLRMRKTETRTFELEKELASCSAREQHLHRSAAAAESKVEATIEQLNDLQHQVKCQSEELNRRAAKQLDLEDMLIRQREALYANETSEADNVLVIERLTTKVASYEETIKQLTAETTSQLASVARLKVAKDISAVFLAPLISENPSLFKRLAILCEEGSEGGRDLLNTVTAVLPTVPPAPVTPLPASPPPVIPPTPPRALSSSIMLKKAPNERLGMLWSSTRQGLILRAVDAISPASSAGAVAFIGRRLISTCGIPIFTTDSLATVTSPMTALDLVFEGPTELTWQAWNATTEEF